MTLILLVVPACAGPHREPSPADVAPWLRADARRCLLLRDLSEGMETMAQHCAERFVRENGYTVAPAAADSSRWVLEVGESPIWSRVLAGREGTLEETASTVQCSMRQCVVLFRSRRHTLACTYRAVTMTQVYTRLNLEPGLLRDARCRDRQA